jgi:hypothetical protein
VRVREIMMALVLLALLCLGVAQAAAGEPVRSMVCVSAVGPVDAAGHGATEAVEQGDCP